MVTTQTEAQDIYDKKIADAQLVLKPLNKALEDAVKALADYDKGRKKYVRSVEDAFEALEGPNEEYAAIRDAAHAELQAALTVQET